MRINKVREKLAWGNPRLGAVGKSAPRHVWTEAKYGKSGGDDYKPLPTFGGEAHAMRHPCFDRIRWMSRKRKRFDLWLMWNKIIL